MRRRAVAVGRKLGVAAHEHGISLSDDKNVFKLSCKADCTESCILSR